MNEAAKIDFTELNTFLRKNRSVDFRRASLRRRQSIETYNWHVSGEEKETLLRQLRIYQSVLRVLPKDLDESVAIKIAEDLLKKDIQSPLQIATTPQRTFIQENLSIFADNKGLAGRVYKRAVLKELNTLLRKNRSVDIRRADLLRKSSIEALRWHVSGEEKEALLRHLKAYQRMLRVLPDNLDESAAKKIAGDLLKKGFESSLQIAASPRRAFIQDNLSIFADDAELAGQVYKRAVACRKRVALKYINRSQQLEPHARATGLNR
ncbi:MAG: hypothetical protein ACL93V_04960 [Candidatus Electrothrix sp. YB6]